MFKRGQVMLEYLLLLGLVVVIALASFRPKGVIEQTVNASKDYYQSGTAAIMGGYYDDAGKVVIQDPKKIDGAWCAWSRCINGVKVRECACPRAAFGGAECADNPDGATKSCGTSTEACDSSKNLHYIIGYGCGCYDFEYWNGDKCVSCPPGEKFCNGQCTNVLTDAFNCGTCGNVCVSANPTCTNGRCAIDGGWTPWSPWDTCSKTCGGGLQFRFRDCTNPMPLFGGNDCSSLDGGQAMESRPCNQQACPQDGAWGGWVVTSPCAKVSGAWDQPGVWKQTETRLCNNPSPTGGGLECLFLDNVTRGMQESRTIDCACIPNCPMFQHYCCNGCAAVPPWDPRHANCGPDGCGGFCPGITGDKTSANRNLACTGSGNCLPCTSKTLDAGTGKMECSGYREMSGHDFKGYFCGSPEASAVNGGWTLWGNWTACVPNNGICGAGTRAGTRTCTNPPPSTSPVGAPCVANLDIPQNGTLTNAAGSAVSQTCTDPCPSVSCEPGYTLVGQNCVANTCTAWSLGALWDACLNNLLPITQTQNYTLAANCDTPQACKAKCKVGYMYSGGSCVCQPEADWQACHRQGKECGNMGLTNYCGQSVTCPNCSWGNKCNWQGQCVCEAENEVIWNSWIAEGDFYKTLTRTTVSATNKNLNVYIRADDLHSQFSCNGGPWTTMITPTDPQNDGIQTPKNEDPSTWVASDEYAHYYCWGKTMSVRFHIEDRNSSYIRFTSNCP